ncbi:FKBP-type peptidyl-prolyl cis-trans isomerase [Dokdonia sp. R86516]|uniref:FKBP-type peptidyl-prolyl cis-trans isomerase n=1 Tax=Dokdonia sp. R86516 TaxID=3093856 RepID=UPI0037C5E662
MKLRNYLGLAIVLLLCVGCPSDDDADITIVPPRDRGEQAVEDDAEIRDYLETHFYNYEEFENPTADFDYKIRFDTIASVNSDKTPIIDRPELTSLTYNREDTDQTIYILTARQGSSEKPAATYADSTLLNYTGRNLNSSVFDSSPNPVWFDLTRTIDGFQNGIAGFKGAGSGPMTNGDGTTAYEDYGVGAVFIPSGLAYFNLPPGSVEIYSPLVFTFSVFNVVITDHDDDGIITIDEDLDGNGFLFDEADDPDSDLSFAYQDPDDDNDGVTTRLEITLDEEGNLVSFIDTDGDGINNHLDDDDDGDGRNTIDEIRINSSTGVVTYTDTDGDGTPDYLDADS